MRHGINGLVIAVEIGTLGCKFLKTGPDGSVPRMPVPHGAEPFTESWLYMDLDIPGNDGGGSAGCVDTALEGRGEDVFDVESC